MENHGSSLQPSPPSAAIHYPSAPLPATQRLTNWLFNRPFFADINQAYAEAMHYKQADQLSRQVIWLHFVALIGLVILNAYLKLPQLIPSPFGWRVLTMTEGSFLLLAGLSTTLAITFLQDRLTNHYLWRLLVAASLLIFSYLFVFASGGSIEMHYLFLLVMAYVTIYADWRINWFIATILAVQHLIVDLILPGWLYIYGANGLAPVLNMAFILIMATFTTIIANNYRDSVEALVLAKQRNDQFVAIASHELKTPLTSIKGYLDIIMRRMKRQSDPSLVHAQKMDEQLTKVISMVRDLLDISIRQSGQMELNREMISVESIINQAIEEVRAVAHGHDIKVEGNMRVMIEGDRIKLGQLMNNLLNNAIKYSPESDKVLVKVNSARDRLVVSVQDFGIGISQTERNKIFEPYFRGNDAKRSHVPGGLGMGLFVCDEIVRNHQGRLWVDSIPGQGSTFSFMLPLPRQTTRSASQSLSQAQGAAT